jgi:hypothetical protein
LQCLSLIFYETKERLQVLASWCSDMAYWIGIPVSWMTAYWIVFLAVVLAIVTVSCIIVYILFRINQEMVHRDRRLHEAKEEIKKQKIFVIQAEGLLYEALDCKEVVIGTKNGKSMVIRLLNCRKNHPFLN